MENVIIIPFKAAPTEGIAMMFLGLLAPLMLLFAGFFISRHQIPGWWIWAYWMSFLQYADKILLFTFHFNILY